MSKFENQKFKTKPESQKKPGFPRQKAIKNAEILEKDLEHYVDDLQKMRETLEETREEREHIVDYRVDFEKIYERACLEFSKLPKMPEYFLEEIVNSFLEKTKEVSYNKLSNTMETGAMVSAICNGFAKQHIEQETEKGTKYEDIKPLTVNIKKTDTSFIDLGFRNADKLNLNIKGDIEGMFGAKMQDGEIIIEGNAETDFGRKMQGGKIRVKGDAKGNVGREMQGGEITIEGNSEKYIGLEMQGGKITIKGSANETDFRTKMQYGEIIRIKEDPEPYIGAKMQDGEIIIEGNAENYVGAEMQDGKITIKGSAEHVIPISDEKYPISDEKYGRTGGKIIVQGKSI